MGGSFLWEGACSRIFLFPCRRELAPDEKGPGQGPFCVSGARNSVFLAKRTANGGWIVACRWGNVLLHGGPPASGDGGYLKHDCSGRR